MGRLIYVLICIESYSTDSDPDCLDVAIVGGGIGGTYTAYRLRNTGQKISLFEFSGRIGGRMFTAKLPSVEGATVELGAMRFRPKEHTSFVNILNEVGLCAIDFPQNRGNPNETIYYLRGKHLRPHELGGPRTPYNLRPEERLSPEKLLWKLFTENTNMSQIRYPPEDQEEELYSIYTTDGIPLYTMTLDNFYSRYASREAYNYLHDTFVWEYTVGQHGAHFALTLLTYPGDEERNDHMKTIEGGFDRLPKTLLSSFLETSKSHSLHLNHQLEAMDREGHYRLRFSCTDGQNNCKEDVCAKKVILALQRDNVERMDFPPFHNPDFLQRLNSILDSPAQKVFLAYPYAWWKKGNKNILHVRAVLPTKFTYDWGTGTNGIDVLLPSYSDANSVALWRELQTQGSIIPGSLPGEQRVTTAVVDMIHSYMSRIYGIPESDFPPTAGGGMQLWDRFPFKSAWNVYKPGVKMSETRDNILKPFPDHEVFIVSNSWWPNGLQHWSEGTLRMVELLMKRYLYKETS